jgi:hypothetical protein
LTDQEKRAKMRRKKEKAMSSCRDGGKEKTLHIHKNFEVGEKKKSRKRNWYKRNHPDLSALTTAAGGD